jgi:hypothetical protein
VNEYLWQAALETLSSLALRLVDPFGGVIISDWYAPPNSPEERLKVTVYIMDRILRPNGLKLLIFRQTRNGADWHYAPTGPTLRAN